MKIIFLGTGSFAIPTLDAITRKKDWQLLKVVSGQAKPTGRGREEKLPAVAHWAHDNNIELLTPKNLREEEIVGQVLSGQPDIIITAAYGKIIPSLVFDIPPYKTVNIHPSLLPKGRGPSPIAQALLEGKKETGVSLMLIDQELDHGPVLSQEKISIEPTETYIDLEPKLSQLGAKMIIRDIPLYIESKLKPKEQEHDKATFNKKISKEDGHINWNHPAQEIYNKWRAYVVWPGIFAFAKKKNDNMRLEFARITIARDHDQSKSVSFLYKIEDKLYANCGDGAINIEEIKPEGKRKMTAKEFINGYKDLVGIQLL